MIVLIPIRPRLSGQKRSRSRVETDAFGDEDMVIQVSIIVTRLWIPVIEVNLRTIRKQAKSLEDTLRLLDGSGLEQPRSLNEMLGIKDG